MRNILNTLVFRLKNIIFRPKAVEQYKTAVKNCNLTAEQLLELNWHKRKAIVWHAYSHTVFYKKYYDEIGFHPDMLTTLEDWEKVPVLEKEMVRKYTEYIKADNINKKYFGESTTGGSTGAPLKVYTDKRFNIEILGWRAFKWWNVSPAANIGIVHRRVPVAFVQKFLNRALWFPTKRIYLNASSISDADLKKFVTNIKRKKISWLQGYVGGLECVADYILKENIKIDTLEVVWSTSAPLYKNVRQKLEKAFNCKIMNQYGSCEVANIAIQCPHSNNLHINYDFVHLDIADKNNCLILNEEGDVLVTSLYGFTFPLIKYRIGDKGRLLESECSCKNPLPLLAEIQGRISDAVYTPDGLYISGDYLTTVFDNYVDYINQFQIYQKNDYSITIYVKPYSKDEKTLKIISDVKEIIKQNVTNKVPVNVEIVDKINDDRGKIRYILSEIALSKVK